jgi:hypothetical protein
MSDDPDGLAWLYEAGKWRLTGDLITCDGDDVLMKYAEASSTGGVRQRQRRRVPGTGTARTGGRPAGPDELVVRTESPQCLILIEGPAGSSWAVYAAGLPDGLDVMARWAPIITAALAD